MKYIHNVPYIRPCVECLATGSVELHRVDDGVLIAIPTTPTYKHTVQVDTHQARELLRKLSMLLQMI